MLDEAGATVVELVASQVLPEARLRFFEQRAEGIAPPMVGAVQQSGKLYRLDRFLARGPLLLVGSWSFPLGERFPRHQPIRSHYLSAGGVANAQKIFRCEGPLECRGKRRQRFEQKA